MLCYKHVIFYVHKKGGSVFVTADIC